MPNRRDFLKASAAGLLGASLLHPIRGQASVAPFKLTASEGEVVFGGEQENATRVGTVCASITRWTGCRT
jgi:anaerobic selenocysteine-containing dehydrogenase